MGKQICFFVTPIDIKQLFEEIHIEDCILLNSRNQKMSFETFFDCVENDFLGQTFGNGNCFITKEKFQISNCCQSESSIVDSLVSEVIQFRACTQSPRKKVDTSSVDDLFKKDGIIVIDDQEKYDLLMSDLLKNPIYIDNPNYVKNGFEYGRMWYTAEYYDSNGQRICKCKELDVLYLSIKKYVTKNYKQSKNKFAYIGPDAYQQYLDGLFVPCSGKNRIVF